MTSLRSSLFRRANLTINQTSARRGRKTDTQDRTTKLESLESRLLMSFSSSIIGSLYTVAGNYWQYESLDSTMVDQGSVTFHAQGQQTSGPLSGAELDTVNTTTSGSTTFVSTIKDFFSNSSAGFVDDGNTTSEVENGVETNSTLSTFSPSKILLPATMVQGQTYPINYTKTDTDTTTGETQTVTTSTVNEQLTLESNSTSPLLVLGKTYNAYQVNMTTTTTPQGGTASTDTEVDYFAPGAGLVEEVQGTLAVPTGYLDLESSSLTGGGGGGSTGTGLAPAILKDTVPSAVVGGAKLHAALTLHLTDSLSTAENGFTVQVYASTSSTLDTTTATLVTSVTKPTTVKSGKTSPLSVSIAGLPASLPDGTYYLFAQTTDGSGNTDSVAAPTTVVVATPFVTLSETVTTTLPPSLVSGTTAKGTVTVMITNNGNVPSKGMTPIDVTASTTSGVLGTTIATVSKNLNILPDKSAKVVVPIKQTPALPDGSYFIVAEVTDPFAAGISIGSSTGTITVAAPFITLAAILGPVTTLKAGDTLTLTNNGNIADDGAFSATIGFSLDAAGLSPIGSTASASHVYNIKSNKSIKVHSNDWAKLTAGLVAGVPYYLTVLATDSTGHTAFAVSTTSFTL